MMRHANAKGLGVMVKRESSNGCGVSARSGVMATLWGAAVRMWAAIAVLMCAAALSLCVAAWAAPSAWAANENLVNPQQRPDSSFIYDTSISALNSADTYYDNQTVQVVGEAVGDIINADAFGDYKWVNLSSEEQGITYSVAIYMASGTAARIDSLGGYGTVGTTLQVRGTFHLVCPEHEGVTDIHADVVSVVDAGADYPERFSAGDFIPGAVTIVVGFVLMVVFYRLKERQR